jgi:hypothetical protein
MHKPHVNIFDVCNELARWGFWYCVWRGHSLTAIFIASRRMSLGPSALKKTKWGLMTLASPLLPTNSKESDRESRTNRIA